MNNITIVTAFYDIDRENWNSYSRSNEEYFRCFKLLCELKNKIIVFTQNKFKKQFEDIISTIKTDLIVLYDDAIIENDFYINKINEIQKSPDYLNGILTPDCPEYWNPYYVFVNFLKSKFCIEAIERVPNIDNTVAWIDFGYVKKEEQLPKTKLWNYHFDDNIHLWNIKNIPQQVDLTNTIKTNTVYIQGCHIVSPKNKWYTLNKLMNEQLEYLLMNNLIDDDQTLLLMSLSINSKEFQIHYEDINYQDLGWFFIFQYYNENCDDNVKKEMEYRK
jgi:protein YibB